VAEGVFPDGHGLAVRRDRFDAWLLDQAREAGVVVHEGQTLPKDIDARRIVAADGLHSSYGEGCADRPLRIGFSTRVSGLEAGDKVEIRFRKDGEVYLSPAGQDTLVVVLGRASRLRGQSRESVLARFLGGAAFERTAPILGMGPLGRTVRNVVSGEVALIGDAAGAPDPITGEGMSLALRSAIRLADAIRKADIQTYARWRRREGAKARRLGRRFLAIGRVSDRVVGSLNRRPDLMGVLMRVMTGAQDLTAVSIANWIRLFLT
jgi:flavin-dependent dehydrogenase